VRLNTSKLFKDSTRRVSGRSTLLPHLEALPQDENKKATGNEPKHDLGGGAKLDTFS